MISGSRGGRGSLQRPGDSRAARGLPGRCAAAKASARRQCRHEHHAWGVAAARATAARPPRRAAPPRQQAAARAAGTEAGAPRPRGRSAPRERQARRTFYWAGVCPAFEFVRGRRLVRWAPTAVGAVDAVHRRPVHVLPHVRHGPRHPARRRDLVLVARHGAGPGLQVLLLLLLLLLLVLLVRARICVQV